MMALHVIFWLLCLAVDSPYVLFPAIVAIRAFFFPRPYRRDDATPPVSVVVACHNEAGSIRARIENLLAQDYPKDRLEVIVVSDGSTDGTDAIAREYEARGVRVLSAPRRGKAAALNDGVAVTTGKIILFTDANAEFAPDAVRAIVRPFGDPEVGGVAGDQRYRGGRAGSGSGGGAGTGTETGTGAAAGGDAKEARSGTGAGTGACTGILTETGTGAAARGDATEAGTPETGTETGTGVAARGDATEAHAGGDEGAGERAYWDLDRLLKRAETRGGNVVSATGSIYAIRRALFSPVPPGVTDDFVISTRVVARGFRLVFEPRAVSYEPVAASARAESGRKVRLLTRGLRGVLEVRELLDPRRYGFYALQLLSHKVLRRLAAVPAFLLFPVTAAAAALDPGSAFFRAAIQAQAAVYALGLAGLVLGGTRIGRLKVLALPAYFCLVNAAVFAALGNIARGRRYDVWEPERERVESAGSPPRPAGRPENFAKLLHSFGAASGRIGATLINSTPVSAAVAAATVGYGPAAAPEAAARPACVQSVKPMTLPGADGMGAGKAVP